MPTARTNRVRRGRICATHTHQPETPPSCKHAGHGINDEKRSGSLFSRVTSSFRLVDLSERGPGRLPTHCRQLSFQLAPRAETRPAPWPHAGQGVRQDCGHLPRNDPRVRRPAHRLSIRPPSPGVDAGGYLPNDAVAEVYAAAVCAYVAADVSYVPQSPMARGTTLEPGYGLFHIR
eukprot:874755-Prorocentrum_minimum.AAC.3